MKRALTILLLLLIISPLVLSQETTEATIQGSETSQLSALKGGLNEKTEDILEKQVGSPILLKTSEIIFKLENPTRKTFFFAIILFLLISMFIGNALMMFSSFKSSTSTIISIGITTLIGIVGIIKQMIGTTYTIGKYVAIAIIAILIFRIVVEKIVNSKKISIARESGSNLRRSKENIEKFSEEILKLK